jgi:hypothetical protein
MSQPNELTNIPLTVQLIHLIIKYTFHCRENEVIFVADNILDLVRLLVPANKVCKIIPEGKSPLENQETDGWAIFKMT